MAKLPDNFVKPPPASSRLTATKPPAGKLSRRSRKADELANERAIDTEAASHVDAVLVRLSSDEHAALSAACEALARVGHTVSIEDMVKQVIARWIAATRAMQALPALSAPSAAPSPALPDPAGRAAPASALPAPLAPALAAIRGQLRRLAAEPIRRWQALGQRIRQRALRGRAA
jgi:hypothetical protein